MEALWFWIAGGMIVVYVVLDGLDLGAGIVHRFVARTDAERADVLRSIGPIWDGNEVWLLAAGATLVLAFPRVYATAFSGFYLPLMLVLWLLIGRACAIEFRHQIESRTWRSFWDTIFMVSSALLALCFGTALGNVVRGVPLDASGSFFEPLWTHFGVHGRTGVLDVFTVLVGVTALAALALHGSIWLAHKLEGPVEARARTTAKRLCFAVAALDVGVTAASFSIQPHLLERLREVPLGFALGGGALGGLALAFVSVRRGATGRALVGSSAHLAGLLAAAAYGLFPFVLPSNLSDGRGLTIDNASAASSTLATSLYWFVPGIALAVGYQVWTFRRFAGKLRPGDGHE